MSILNQAFAKALDPSAPPLLSQIMAAARQGHLCLRSSLSLSVTSKAIVHDAGRYYLQRNWVLETAIVEEMGRLLSATPEDLFDPERFILPETLSLEQAEAAKSVLTRSLTLLSGGPGTGKSFLAIETLAALARAHRSGSFRVKIAAPTGKAADRLAAALPPLANVDIEALTLHRLLGLQPGRTRLFEHHPLDADLIIADEASMIDASLFAHLLQAVPDGCRLFLLGDADQLPPVDGAGVFSDLADLFAIRLRKNHRLQNERLYSCFDAARTGSLAPLLEILEPPPTDLFGWIETEFQLTAQFETTRLISPLRKGPFGVDAINAHLLERLQSRLAYGESWSAPLLVLSNDPVQKLYNGTPGTLQGIYQGGSIPYGSEEVLFADGRRFLLRQLPGYELAFAISAHKSQGSEFDKIVCLLPPGSEEFGREALYTALTRAKKEIRLVGEKEILEKVASKHSQSENGLKERLNFFKGSALNNPPEGQAPLDSLVTGLKTSSSEANPKL